MEFLKQEKVLIITVLKILAQVTILIVLRQSDSRKMGCNMYLRSLDFFFFFPGFDVKT